MRLRFFAIFAWAWLGSGVAVSAGENPPAALAPGWGIDACLTRHVPAPELPRYLELLETSAVRMLREREVGGLLSDGSYHNDARVGYRLAKAHGHSVVAFASLPVRLPPAQSGNVLPEDLRKVFEQGRLLGRDCAGLVDAWEMVGEPDIGFCTDLPDRVVAYQKALYLGLKAGAVEAARKPETRNLKPEGKDRAQVSGLRSQPSAHAPLVLMGALGMPPGPWLERAAANGLLDYTDAYNFHFYGHAKDLTGVIEAHRGFLRKQGPPAKGMPLWITECGIEAVDKKDFLNPQRRQMQASFTSSTARQALAASDVAVFMPFILVEEGDPYAMVLSAERTFPAWNAYAKFTRENPWPERPLARPPANPNPIVMQWLPDNRTCVPHKVSGTYRFRGPQPIKGELRIYNFGSTAVEGRIEMALLKKAAIRNRGPDSPSRAISVPPMETITVPLEFTAIAGEGFREWVGAAFVEQSGRHSPVFFGVEREGTLADFVETPLAVHPLPGEVIRFPQVAEYQSGEHVGVWSTMNGLKGKDLKPETGNLKPEMSGPNIQVPGFNSLAYGTASSSSGSFWIERRNTDPLVPTMAVAGIDGLPGHGFIRMQLDKPMTKARKVLVVLVDDRGQRYTIWENFGADYYGSRSDIWLNLEDFHADFWGPCSADYRFRPKRIREVHLRFYLDDPGDVVGVRLSLLTRLPLLEATFGYFPRVGRPK